jgi:hypothetical protein
MSSGGYLFFPTFFALFFGLALVFLPALQPQVLHIFGSPLLFFVLQNSPANQIVLPALYYRLGQANQLEFLRRRKIRISKFAKIFLRSRVVCFGGVDFVFETAQIYSSAINGD